MNDLKNSNKIMKQTKLHSAPYSGANNRKWTLGRVKLMSKVQSIPIYEKDTYGNNKKLLGYKYIYH